MSFVQESNQTGLKAGRICHVSGSLTLELQRPLSRRQRSFQRVQAVVELAPARLLEGVLLRKVGFLAGELALATLMRVETGLDLLDSVGKIRIIVRRSPRVVQPLQIGCHHGNALADWGQLLLHIRNLFRDAVDALFFDLKPCDEQLRLDSGSGGLSNIGAEGFDF